MLRMSFFTWSAIISSCVLVLSAKAVAGAQTSTPLAQMRRFEVASVKPTLINFDQIRQAMAAGRTAGIPPAGFRIYPGGRFTATRVNLRRLILRAFDLEEYQLEGGPAWMATDYFDVNAIASRDITDEEANEMLRTLLAERFSLSTRVDVREQPVHVLTVLRPDGRLGPSLTRTSAACEAEVVERRRTGEPVPPLGPPPASAEATRVLLRTPRCGAVTHTTDGSRGMMIVAGGTPLSTLVTRLSRELGASVVDRTGLEGLFNFTLDYAPPRPLPRPGLAIPDTDPPSPPLQSALQRQLGLRLEVTAASGPLVVIERAERPTAD